MSSLSTLKISPKDSLKGEITVPGDKSISHRAIMLGAIAEGNTHINGFLTSEDCFATMRAFQAMGVKIEQPATQTVIVHGVGKYGLTAPKNPLDLGNSGTSIRLMTGLLAGAGVNAELTGDSSLQKRPMERVVAPLRLMGSDIVSHDQGRPPLLIKKSQALHGIDYRMPIASAQVKSSLLLAGLYANGQTSIEEPAITRDHTERMLQSLGYRVVSEPGHRVSLQGGAKLLAAEINIPGDISSAAFFLVAASIVEKGDLLIKNVGINPTRTGIITLLQLMGAQIELCNQRNLGQEPVADLHVKSAPLHGIEVPVELVSLAIDEFPILFIAAACARGKTVLRGAEELRVKESDRILSMAKGLQSLGIDAQPLPDGMVIEPGEFQGGVVDSYGDHRIAMAFAVAALRAKAPIQINDCENIATSFPNFVELLKQLGCV